MASDALTSYPRAVRAQIADLAEILTALLGRNLSGIYLTGSPLPAPHGDAPIALQVLVVTHRNVPRDPKLGLLEALLRRSRQPAAIELLVVRHADLLATDPALPIQLHFAEGSRPEFTADTQSLMWLSWPDGPSGAIDRGMLLDQLEPNAVALVGSALPPLGRTAAVRRHLGEPGTRHLPPGQQLPFGGPTRPA